MCGGELSGIPFVALSHSAADDNVNVRFQTVFLPLVDGPVEGYRSMQFAVEAYGYRTGSEDDPRNLVMLATSQGLSVLAESVGPRLILLQSGAPPFTSDFWCKAETS